MPEKVLFNYEKVWKWANEIVIYIDQNPFSSMIKGLRSMTTMIKKGLLTINLPFQLLSASSLQVALDIGID